jgi:hypothetical protein
LLKGQIVKTNFQNFTSSATTTFVCEADYRDDPTFWSESGEIVNETAQQGCDFRGALPELVWLFCS